MNKISLRIGINRNWNHLYFQNLSYLDPRLTHGNIQFPHAKSDEYLKRLISGYIKFKKLEIHKTRELIDIYISKDRYISTGFACQLSSKIPSNYNHIIQNKVNLSILRVLLNIFKSRIQIYNLYTFPIHDAELIIKYILRDYKNKQRLNTLKRLLSLGIIKGIKIKIKGRYKKSTRTQNDVYQFGQIPNTPTTNLSVKLFYSTYQLIGPLGTSSLHIYIVYGDKYPSNNLFADGGSLN